MLQCNAQLKGLSWASWSNVPKYVMALGISAAVAVAVGQSRSGAAQPDPLFLAAAAVEAECKISPQSGFICCPEY